MYHRLRTVLFTAACRCIYAFLLLCVHNEVLKLKYLTPEALRVYLHPVRRHVNNMMPNRHRLVLPPGNTTMIRRHVVLPPGDITVIRHLVLPPVNTTVIRHRLVKICN